MLDIGFISIYIYKISKFCNFHKYTIRDINGQNNISISVKFKILQLLRREKQNEKNLHKI